MLHSVPVGTRAFVIRACRQLQNTHAKLVKGIQKLPEGELQTKLALFRYCAGPRLDYHLRCLALPFGAPLATEADTITMHELDTLCGSLLTLQGLPPEELNTVKAQIRLPGKWGGLGLATRVRIHPIAFYAAWLRTLQNNFTCNAFLSRLGTACRGADPSAEHLLEDLASSMDQLEQQLSLASRWTTSRLSSRTSARIRKIALWSTALPTGDAAPASTNPPLAGPLQQILSQESHRRAFEDIVDNSALDDRTRARVRSASGAGAGGWLRDLPSTGSELLSTEEIRCSLRLLLGLPIPGLRTTPECTVCAKPHAADGTQRLFHCSTSAGNWTLRHNRIRDELARHLRRWHIPDVQVEPYGFFEGSRLRPDIVVRHHRTGKQYVIDVKVESPLRAHLLARAACQSGYAAANAEAGKRAKYRDAIGDRHDFQFAPFATEGFGRLGQAAQD
ncbi:MAG: hypothetical protein AAFY26_25785, partial [Cyanobacteria bacterium J06638_22]